ncbi:MAG: hypothetical protein WCI73_07080 [Phycisphaerae bacterium]
MRRSGNWRRICPCLFLSLAGLLGTSAVAATTAPAPQTLETYVRGEIKTALDALATSGDAAAAEKQLDGLFRLVIAHASDKQLDLFRDTDFALRLARQLTQVPDDHRQPLAQYLHANDELAHTLVFLIHEKQSARSVYALLDTLRQQRGDKLGKYPTLAAAICVVHDRPLQRSINENQVTAPDPVDIFDFYSTNENSMLFGIRNVPAELLIYVVDTTATLDEMRWALGKYARDNKVGLLFFQIQYDYKAFTKGSEKKVTAAGNYSLPNILKYGGVCVDQAYFATAVGKSIGVPTAFAVGASSTVGHAWVGYLAAQGREAAWNFDVGRYQAYRGVKGEVLDPQTRHRMPDSFLALTSELVSTKPRDRQLAVALTDAAHRLISLEKSGAELAPPEVPFALPAASSTGSAGTALPRTPTCPMAQELLRLALVGNPAYAPAMLAVRDLAQDGKLTPDQKRFWYKAILQLCGKKYPDFALATLTPMIATVESPKEQDQLWNTALELFKQRSDLAAEIRMNQAHLWEQQKQPAKAMACYQDVIDRYCNAGPFVLKALLAAEELLRDAGKGEFVIGTYESTWKKCDKPEGMAGEFMVQSNWYRVGALLADRLSTAGKTDRAAAVQAQLDAVTAPRK